MNKFVVIIGMGELGELFARGFLKLGYPVYPVLRSMQLATVVSAIPEPELVLLAVGEEDLHSQSDKSGTAQRFGKRTWQPRANWPACRRAFALDGYAT